MAEGRRRLAAGRPPHRPNAPDLDHRRHSAAANSTAWEVCSGGPTLTGSPYAQPASCQAGPSTIVPNLNQLEEALQHSHRADAHATVDHALADADAAGGSMETDGERSPSPPGVAGR